MKFQFGGGFERDATFFHRETSPALISDFMAKLRPRPSRPSIRGIRRPKGALSRSPSLALPLFLRDSIKISRHWPFTCLARRRRRAHGWQMADSIREVRPSVRPSERASECLWLPILLLLPSDRADVVASLVICDAAAAAASFFTLTFP